MKFPISRENVTFVFVCSIVHKGMFLSVRRHTKTLKLIQIALFTLSWKAQRFTEMTYWTRWSTPVHQKWAGKTSSPISVTLCQNHNYLVMADTALGIHFTFLHREVMWLVHCSEENSHMTRSKAPVQRWVSWGFINNNTKVDEDCPKSRCIIFCTVLQCSKCQLYEGHRLHRRGGWLWRPWYFIMNFFTCGLL